MKNTEKKLVTVDEIIEDYTPLTKSDWFSKIIGFEKWVMDNYNKYHAKNNKGGNQS